jgi:LysR family transcriptional activator of nhaA
VIADDPVPAGSPVRAYNHLLGESKLVVMGTAALARPRRRGFPRSLDGAPMLLPLEGGTLRRELNAWFAGHRITPRVVAEAEDTALVTAFAADGMGLMVVPEVIADLIGRRYGLVRCGAIPGLDDRYYAISVERRLVHPAVLAIRDAARDRIFAR